MLKVADKALSNIFFVRFKEANLGFNNALYYFMEDILTKMASKGSMDDMIKNVNSNGGHCHLCLWMLLLNLLNNLHASCGRLQSLFHLEGSSRYYQTEAVIDRQYLGITEIHIIFIKMVEQRQILQTFDVPRCKDETSIEREQEAPKGPEGKALEIIVLIKKLDKRSCVSNSSKDYLLSNLTWLEMEKKIGKAKASEAEVFFLQAVKRDYIQAFHYRTYRLVNRSQ